MAKESHHEELVTGLSAQLKLILEKSEQGIYIYMDDEHKACNKKFASLLGYKSAQEWANIEAPLADVIEADQKKVISAYQKASEKLIASSLDITLRNVKDKSLIKTRMIMTPIAYDGHVMVIHFVSKI